MAFDSDISSTTTTSLYKYFENETKETNHFGTENSDENITHPEIQFRYVGIAIGITDIILGTFGNLLTIIAFTKNRRLRRNVFNHFIVNLGVIDLLTASLMMPFNVAGYMYMEWPFGNDHVTCALQAFFYFSCGYTSVACFLAITLNRFIGIVFPDRYHSLYATKFAKIMLILTWLVAPAFLLPPLIVSIENNIEGHPGTPTGWKERQFLCTYVNFGGWVGYMQLVRVLFQFLPLVIMITAYIIIWYKVHNSNKRLLLNAGSKEYREKMESARLGKTLLTRASPSPNSSPKGARREKEQLRKFVHLKNAETNDALGKGIGHESSKSLTDAIGKENSSIGSSSSVEERGQSRFDAENQRMEREKRLVFVSVLIWVTFTVLFLPSLIIALLPNSSKFSPITHMAASNITWLNSCVNPIIYVFVHKRMRKEYIKIIKGFFRSNCRKPK